MGATLGAATDSALGYRYVCDDFLAGVNGRAWTLRADIPCPVYDKLSPTPGSDIGTTARRRAKR